MRQNTVDARVNLWCQTLGQEVFLRIWFRYRKKIKYFLILPTKQEFKNEVGRANLNEDKRKSKSLPFMQRVNVVAPFSINSFLLFILWSWKRFIDSKSTDVLVLHVSISLWTLKDYITANIRVFWLSAEFFIVYAWH